MNLRYCRLLTRLAIVALTATLSHAQQGLVQVSIGRSHDKELAYREALAHTYAQARSTWQALHFSVISYELAEESMPPAETPLLVKVGRDGRVEIKVKDRHNTHRHGKQANMAELKFRLISPTALFDAVERELRAPPGEIECLKATFDAATGLPTSLLFGCPWYVDGGLSIQITNIRVSQ
jgi:hypothetical protein